MKPVLNSTKMALKVQVSLILCLSLLLASSIVRAQVFNVKKYGARADGKTDSSKAISDAWKAACASKNPSTVLIPQGKYMSGVVTMKGPCSSSMKFQIQGTLLAPTNPSAHHGLPNWITFQHVDEFTLFGGGVFDGQGQRAWSIGECRKSFACKQLPINLRFDFINNGRVEGITSLNSKNFHINVIGCKNLTFEKVTITAPETSTNTDGIHIGRSHGINIINTNIGTGDDCISLGDGSQEIRITGVKCGPGHGISVGSLGKYRNEEPVSGIYVNNCTLTKTTNGVRIKSWPAMYGGTASDMHFENIIMDRVGNPILIDQQYCPWNQCNKKASSKVKISKVSFKNIRGTSTTPEAIQLACSNGLPCEKVELSNINLAYSGPLGHAKFACSNVRPSMSGNLKPAGCKAN